MAKSNKVLTFEGSLETMVKKLNTSRNGIQLHLLNMGILAVKHNNLEGYVKKTVDALDEYGQHTFAEAVIAWVDKFYGYVPDTEGNQKSWAGAQFVKDNYQAAKECKFWTMAKPKQSSFKGHDEASMIFAVLEKGDKMLKRIAAGELSEDEQALVKIDLAQRKAIRAALTQDSLSVH